MMIFLKKDGIYRVYDEEDKLDPVKMDRNVYGLFSSMFTPVSIEDDISLLDIVGWFDSTDSLTVIGMLTGCSIDNFLHELTTPPSEINNDAGGLDCIWLKKVYEIEEYDGEVSLNDYIDCYGVIDSDPDHYSFDFNSWWYIRDVPIKIAKQAHITDDRKFWVDRKRGLANENYQPDTVDVEFTLLDFFRGLFYELGWFGSPEERGEAVDLINDRHDEIKEYLASNHKDYMTLDEFFEKLDGEKD